MFVAISEKTVQERSYWLHEEYFYMKTIVTIISTNLLKDFSEFVFIPFFSFSKNQNKNSNIRQVGDLVKKNISVFSLQLVALYFKDISNLIDLYKGTFSYVIPVRVIVS